MGLLGNPMMGDMLGQVQNGPGPGPQMGNGIDEDEAEHLLWERADRSRGKDGEDEDESMYYERDRGRRLVVTP